MLIKEQQTENRLVYIAEAEDDGKPLKQVLKRRLNMSSRLLTKIKKNEMILVNSQFAKYHQIIQQGNTIEILMDEEPNQFLPQPLPFQVVYEDVDLIVINKQAGIVAHPTKSHPIGTVANAAAYYLESQKKDCRIRFVNRLDMDTSGLLVIAKNPYAHHLMAEQMKENLVVKKYIAFVEGQVEPEAAVIDQPIYRPTEDAMHRVVDVRGQASVSKYRVLEKYPQATMVEVTLLTGRTHQIRVHMSYLGHPIIGDALYSAKQDNSPFIQRHALHAFSLEFQQPRYGHPVQIQAPLPADMLQLQEGLRD